MCKCQSMFFIRHWTFLFAIFEANDCKDPFVHWPWLLKDFFEVYLLSIKQGNNLTLSLLLIWNQEFPGAIFRNWDMEYLISTKGLHKCRSKWIILLVEVIAFVNCCVVNCCWYLTYLSSPEKWQRIHQNSCNHQTQIVCANCCQSSELGPVCCSHKIGR